MTTMLRIAVLVGVFALWAALGSGSAVASPVIEAFNTTSSDTDAGDHPDLTTSFTFADPGAPEAARNVVFNAPEGLFGNPYVVTHCTSSDFAIDSAPPTPRLA